MASNRVNAEDRDGGPRVELLTAGQAPHEVCFRPLTGGIFKRYRGKTKRVVEALQDGLRTLREHDKRGRCCGVLLTQEEKDALTDATRRLTKAYLEAGLPDPDGEDEDAVDEEAGQRDSLSSKANKRLRLKKASDTDGIDAGDMAAILKSALNLRGETQEEIATEAHTKLFETATPDWLPDKILRKCLKKHDGDQVRFVLQTTGWVGRIAFADRAVIIEPKQYVPLSASAFAGMLADHSDFTAFLTDEHATSLDFDPASVLALVYARSSTRALNQCRGPLSDYQTTRRSLPYVRGRIDFRRQMRTQPNLGACTSIACVYGELVEDTPHNRLLKAAATRLLPFVRERLEANPSAAAALDRAVNLLEQVARALRTVQHHSFSAAELAALPDCPNSRYQAYKPAIQLAKVIMLHSTVDSSGSSAGFSYLVNMNDLFERWCRGYLDAVGRAELGIVCEKRAITPPPDAAGSVEPHRFEPDLYLEALVEGGGGGASGDSRRRCVVGDVKYKRLHLNEHGRLLTPRDDAHQIMSYIFQTGASCGLLIYGACDPPEYASSGAAASTHRCVWRADWSMDVTASKPIYVLCLDMKSGLQEARRRLRHAAWHCARHDLGVAATDIVSPSAEAEAAAERWANSECEWCSAACSV